MPSFCYKKSITRFAHWLLYITIAHALKRYRLKLEMLSLVSSSRLSPNWRWLSCPLDGALFRLQTGTVQRIARSNLRLSLSYKREREKKKQKGKKFTIIKYTGTHTQCASQLRIYVFAGVRVYAISLTPGGQNSCHTVGFSLFFSCQQMIYF